MNIFRAPMTGDRIAVQHSLLILIDTLNVIVGGGDRSLISLLLLLSLLPLAIPELILIVVEPNKRTARYVRSGGIHFDFDNLNRSIHKLH